MGIKRGVQTALEELKGLVDYLEGKGYTREQIFVMIVLMYNYTPLQLKKIFESKG